MVGGYRCSKIIRTGMFAAFVSMCGVAVADEVTKLPAPDEAALAAVSKTVSSIYEKDLAAAKAPQEKAKLAAKMFDDGVATRDDAIARFALYRAARKVAIGGGDIDLALRAVEQMTTEFAVDGLALQRDVIVEAAPLAKTSEDQYAMVRYARRGQRTAVALDRFDVAVPLAELAFQAAEKMTDKDVRKQCEAERDRILQMAGAYQKVKPFITALD